MIYISKVRSLLGILISTMVFTNDVYAIEDGSYFCRSTTQVSIDGNEAYKYGEITFALVVKSGEKRMVIPEGWFKGSYRTASENFGNDTIYIDDESMAGKWLFLRQRNNQIDLSVSSLTFSQKEGMNHKIVVANATCDNW